MKLFDVLWLNGSPSLQFLDRPLLGHLAAQVRIAQWQYCQEKDEASSFSKAVQLLQQYLEELDAPVHLIGHGIGGVIGLLCAREYPTLVRSLTLLGVAEQPAMTWQTHYYVQRHLMNCSRQRVLAFMVRSLFGAQPVARTRSLIYALDRDLSEAPCDHSLLDIVDLPKGGIVPPLMVCGSREDSVVHPPALRAWQQWLKPSDQLWECATGRHFFHAEQPQSVAAQVLTFWQSDVFGEETFGEETITPSASAFSLTTLPL